MYEYVVVLADGTTRKVIAEDVIAVVTKNDLVASEVVNIFRNGQVVELDGRKVVTVSTEVYPQIAYETGCTAYPKGEHKFREDMEIVLSAVCTDGWLFDSWVVNGQVVSNEQQFTAKLGSADVTYRAVFKSI